MQAFVQSWFEVSSLHLLLEGKFSGSDDSIFYNNWLILTNHPWQNGAAGQPHHREQAGGSEGGDTSQYQGPLRLQELEAGACHHGKAEPTHHCLCRRLLLPGAWLLPLEVFANFSGNDDNDDADVDADNEADCNINEHKQKWWEWWMRTTKGFCSLPSFPNHNPTKIQDRSYVCTKSLWWPQFNFFYRFRLEVTSWVDIVYLWLASLTGQVVVQLM